MATTTTQELDPPVPALITAYNSADRVGRAQLVTGEEIRFGGTACIGMEPQVGVTAFVTAIGPHPLGGRKAIKLRGDATSEGAARAAAAQRAAEEAAAMQRAIDSRRILVRPLTTPAMIARRIEHAVATADDGDVDIEPLSELADDVELVGPTHEHIAAILQAIASAPPATHFGDPGPLVHLVESYTGYEPHLFAIARAYPTMHFVWFLARIANDEGAHRAAALDILQSYATALDPIVRTSAQDYLASRPRL